MVDERAKVSSYDSDDYDDAIILPIPYEDEAAEEARQREAEERAKRERLAALKSIAPEVVPSGFGADQSAEFARKKQEAENAKAAYEAALAKLKEAEAIKKAYDEKVLEAAAVQSAAEAAQIAAQNAVVDFDEAGNSIVKICVPKEYDVVINFKPKK